jgi:hypothetical protein
MQMACIRDSTDGRVDKTAIESVLCGIHTGVNKGGANRRVRVVEEEHAVRRLWERPVTMLEARFPTAGAVGLWHI